jgi:hypothetical protein
MEFFVSEALCRDGEADGSLLGDWIESSSIMCIIDMEGNEMCLCG